MKVLADIPDEDVKWLDRKAAEGGKSRAALVREAISTYRAQEKPSGDKGWLDQAFGIWKGRDDIGDAVEWQRRMRAEWTRPWDPDYWEVRNEFPDLFDEADDREAERYRK